MIFVIKAVNILYQYASLYPCSLLCFFLFSDQIKYPLRKLVRIFALITLPFAAMPVVLAVFDIENTSFVFSIAYMLVGFICLRKLTRNYAPQKLLFVMCMVAHVAVMAGEMEQAFSTLIRVPFYYAQTHLGFAAVFILLRLGLYLYSAAAYIISDDLDCHVARVTAEFTRA